MSEGAVARPAAGWEDGGPVVDLPEGTMRPVTLSSGERVCLVNDGGEIHAVSDTCTHQEFPMCDGALLPGGRIECAWHGAQFDLRTGAVKRFPATDPLPIYPVRVVDGRIWIGARRR